MTNKTEEKKLKDYEIVAIFFTLATQALVMMVAFLATRNHYLFLSGLLFIPEYYLLAIIWGHQKHSVSYVISTFRGGALFSCINLGAMFAIASTNDPVSGVIVEVVGMVLVAVIYLCEVMFD